MLSMYSVYNCIYFSFVHLQHLAKAEINVLKIYVVVACSREMAFRNYIKINILHCQITIMNASATHLIILGTFVSEVQGKI